MSSMSSSTMAHGKKSFPPPKVLRRRRRTGLSIRTKSPSTISDRSFSRDRRMRTSIFSSGLPEKRDFPTASSTRSPMPNSSSRTSIGRISTRRNWQSASIFISIATDASEPSRNDQQVIFLVQDLDGETHLDRSCLDGCRHPLPGLRGLGLFCSFHPPCRFWHP